MNNWGETIIYWMCSTIGFFIILMSFIRVLDMFLNYFVGPRIRRSNKK